MPAAIDPDNVRIPNYYEAAPADYESVDRVLKRLNRQYDYNQKACEIASDFLNSLKSFRRIEIQHTMSENSDHRQTLAGLIEFGKSFASYLSYNPAIDISASGFSRDDVFANVNYLVDRWDIWYGPRDEEKADAFLNLLESEAQRHI